jgi:hypothetical protein
MKKMHKITHFYATATKTVVVSMVEIFKRYEHVRTKQFRRTAKAILQFDCEVKPRSALVFRVVEEREIH